MTLPSPHIRSIPTQELVEGLSRVLRAQLPEQCSLEALCVDRGAES